MGSSAPFVQEAARFFIILFANVPMGVCGFGDAIVMHMALTLCGMSFPGVCSTAISEAVFNLTVGGLAAMAVQSALIWRDVNWELVRLLVTPIVVGTGLGLVALYHIHSLWLKQVLGIIFLSVGCYQIQGEVMRAKGLIAEGGSGERRGQLVVKGSDKEGLRQMGRVLGLASGVLAGLFGTGGPPLMVLVAVTDVGKDEWRASNAVIWLVDNVVRFAYLYAVQRQMALLNDGPSLVSLMIAGGVGVYAGSVLSPMVDGALFRRLLILLMLLGANVMLFAGTPGGVALSGVLSIFSLLILYILALWHQPLLLAKGGNNLAPAGVGMEEEAGSHRPQRWLGNAGYNQVATREQEEDGEEETDELLVDKHEGKENVNEGKSGCKSQTTIEMVVV
ncbi:Hypothetical protein NocV09_02800260 [Nannochloropsis oceanica]